MIDPLGYAMPVPALILDPEIGLDSNPTRYSPIHGCHPQEPPMNSDEENQPLPLNEVTRGKTDIAERHQEESSVEPNEENQPPRDTYARRQIPDEPGMHMGILFDNTTITSDPNSPTWYRVLTS